MRTAIGPFLEKTSASAFAVILLLGPALAYAQAPGEAADGAGWEKVNGAMIQPGEGFQANHLVAAAYAFIWLMVAGFVLTVWLRTDAVEREVFALRRQIDDRAKKP